MFDNILKLIYKNWRYFLVTPLFLTGLLTAFLFHNGISIDSPEAMLSYFILSCLGIVPGFLLVFGSIFVRILVASTVLFLLVLSQLSYLSFLPIWSTYWYAIVLLVVCTPIIFYLLHKQLDSLLVIVFSVFWIGAFFTAKTPFIVTENFTQADDTNNKMPPYFQIILDEHIGIEGVSYTDAQTYAFFHSLKDKYIQSGFRVYGNVYSREMLSTSSFASFLNFKPIQHTSAYFFEEKETNIITKNALFDELSNQGYQINVLQSSYLDFCRKTKHLKLKTCVTYQQSLLVPSSISVNTAIKYIPILNNIFAMLHLSTLLEKIEQMPIWSALSLPKMDNSKHISTISATSSPFDELLKLAKNAQVGNAYFVHLLLPHRPFVFDENCNYIGERGTNIYDYLEQVKCTHKLMDKLIQTLNDNPNTKNSTIVIHGDHGSRIQIPPIKNNYFTAENLIQTFSSFFIVKSPIYKASYDNAQLPLDVLLKSVVRREKPRYDGDQVVFLRSYDSPERCQIQLMPTFSKGHPQRILLPIMLGN